jgi:hypothetical protein
MIFNRHIVVILLLALQVFACESNDYGRGAGRVPPISGKCRSSENKENGLCYKKCRDGYKGDGPVCWCSFDAPPTCGAGQILCSKSQLTQIMYAPSLTTTTVTHVEPFVLQDNNARLEDAPALSVSPCAALDAKHRPSML